MKIDPENVIITNGSQQTIDIVSKMFINRGDRIIIDKPSYLGAIQAMSAYIPEFLPVDLLDDGPNTYMIENYCINKNPKYM